MRTTAALIVFLCAAVTATADDTYRLSPFSPAYDTINQKTLRNFETLPLVTDDEIPKCNAGTKSDAEAFARSYVMKTEIKTTRWAHDGNATKTQGKHTVELYGPANIEGKRLYFWIVKGMVNHQSQYWISNDIKDRTPPKEGFTNLYTVIFYQTPNDKPKTVFYIIHNRDQEATPTICNAVAAIVDPEHKRLTQERHDAALKKDSWNNTNGKPAEGKLEAYKNGKITLRTQAGSTKTIDAAKLTLDDQDILRGYLDQLEIPVK
ncbi:MAG: hypothetical protein ACRC46_13290 [Thermoguttaceae bacterium]